MAARSTSKQSDLDSEHIVASLASGANATVLRAYFGPKEYIELSALARAKKNHSNGTKVYLLPGIMGSSLGIRDRNGAHPIWLNPDAIAAGELLALALPEKRTLQPLDVLLPGYLKLKLQLEIAGFDVMLHAFDWRKSIAVSGKLLLQRIAREKKKSIAIVAHSMGGLVARAALAHDTSRKIKTIVQLGTPNFGSFAPVLALRAVYGSVRKIATLDPDHSAEQLSRHVFRSLPGVYELLPVAQRTFDLDLTELSSWPNDLLGPDATMLANARRVRERLGSARAQCFHIVGMAQPTTTAVERRDKGFDYIVTTDGDGTVPRALADWPGAEHFFVRELHGCLTQNHQVAGAIIDLLKNGRTKKLPQEWRNDESKIARRMRDETLRRELRGKLRWSDLPLSEQRNILDPTISAEFLAIFKAHSEKI